MSPYKVLILGANGQLGQAFVKALSTPSGLSLGGVFSCADELRQDSCLRTDGALRRDGSLVTLQPISMISLVGPSQGGLDLSNSERLREYLHQHKPNLVINAAAYTAVDQAEQEADLAYQINAHALECIAQALTHWQGKLIHFSTDYVFGADAVTSTRPYVLRSETDKPGPVNTYGASKLAGEQAILESGVEALIVRTSWLYAAHGNNFMLTMRQLMQSREVLNVVDDQWGVPSSVDFLLEHTLALWQQGARGLVHVVPDGACTWYEYAQVIASELVALGESLTLKTLQPMAYAEYRQLINKKMAERPYDVVLDNRRLKQFLAPTIRPERMGDNQVRIPISTWQAELKRVLRTLYPSASA